MKLILRAALLFFPLAASAGSISGTVNMLEVWSNGNVAFTLNNAITTCNGMFIVNVSSPGSKNMYAALLAAKHSGKTVNVYYSDQCGAADNYGGSYHMPNYLYPN